MLQPARILRRYRVAVLALAVSALLHAAVFVSVPHRISPDDEPATRAYTATLDPAAANVEAPPAPAPVRRARAAHPRARIAPPPPPPPPPPQIPGEIAPIESTQLAALAAAPELAPAPEPAPAVAQAPPPEAFPADDFPARVTIDYQLSSVFADGRATYRWERTGDQYAISAEAAAEGFFTLFLEGRILQESRGTVTAEGLRPSAFSERKPGGPVEGLEFDWSAHKITFDRNGERKTADLADNTVDWLSMIFQLAHVPPKGESFALQVFTQRRMYRFQLRVLGIEEIEIPLGRVRALHLNHTDPDNPKEVVDVWLGVDQHYLPVKLRFPAARNRLVVEQVATRISMSDPPR